MNSGCTWELWLQFDRVITCNFVDRTLDYILPLFTMHCSQKSSRYTNTKTMSNYLYNLYPILLFPAQTTLFSILFFLLRKLSQNLHHCPTRNNITHVRAIRIKGQSLSVNSYTCLHKISHWIFITQWKMSKIIMYRMPFTTTHTNNSLMLLQIYKDEELSSIGKHLRNKNHDNSLFSISAQ